MSKKLLSDGTVARANMYVWVNNHFGKGLAKIMATKNGTPIVQDCAVSITHSECIILCLSYFEDTPLFKLTHGLTLEPYSRMRKATKEEIKQYKQSKSLSK